MPFTPHTMLAHQWKKPSTYWWRRSKTFTTRGRNMSTRISHLDPLRCSSRPHLYSCTLLNTYTTYTLDIVINHTDDLPHLDSFQNLRLTPTSKRVGLNPLQTSQVVQGLVTWGYHLPSFDLITDLFSLGLSASQTSPWPPSQFNNTHESHRCQQMKVHVHQDMIA
jgi:hypothetical protein